MAKLSYQARKDLPSGDFVFPKERRFPIEDRSHAANAKSRAAAIGGKTETKVDRAVARKYPTLGKRKDDMAKKMKR